MLTAAVLDGYRGAINGLDCWPDLSRNFYDSLRWTVFLFCGFLTYRLIRGKNKPFLAVVPIVLMLLFQPMGETMNYNSDIWFWTCSISAIVLCGLAWGAAPRKF